MPGIDGLELQRRLKAMDVAIPVIVITGHGDVPLAVQAMKGGAVDFIEKPFSDEALLGAIRVAVGRHAHDAARETEISAIKTRMATLSVRETEYRGSDPGPSEQDHRLRPRYQRADGRGSPR